MPKHLIAYLLILSHIPVLVFAKNDKVNYKAKQLIYNQINGEPCRQLKGEVVCDFLVQKMTMYADEVLHYDNTDIIEAFGRVKIVSKDYVIHANALFYDPKKEAIVLEKDVLCQLEEATLHSSKFVYHLKKQQGEFFNQGKLVYKDMEVVSQRGIYDVRQQTFSFIDDVVFVDPNCTLRGDYLSYNRKREEATFKNHVEVYAHDTNLTADRGGIYNMPKKKFILYHATISNSEFEVYGDKLEIIDELTLKASRHVTCRIPSEGITIAGDYLSYAKNKKSMLCKGSPLLSKDSSDGPFYVRANQFLISLEEKNNKMGLKSFQGCKNVQFYHKNVQGLTSDIVYNSSNEILQLGKNPILWLYDYQVTGCNVTLHMGGGDQEFTIDKDVFLISCTPEDAKYRDQLKGDRLTAVFREKVLSSIRIDGNSECLIANIKDEQKVDGINHIKCGHIAMNIVDNQLTQVTFSDQPQGVYYPLEQMHSGISSKLTGYKWYGDQRPTQERILQDSSS